jgi:hypothetical protein
MGSPAATDAAQDSLMLLMGDRIWWLPKPLERVLPRLNV